MSKNQYSSPNHNESTKYDNNNTSASIGYQYVSTLKPVGYIVGDPISIPSNNNDQRYLPTQQRPQTPILGTKSVNQASRSNSRVIYSPGSDVIVHEHPSRPVRSPSPISHNPNANVVPQTNFIYNSAPMPMQQTQVLSRVVSYSPAKIPVVQSKIPTASTNYNNNMVPRSQYQRCVSECKVWEQKYNELYTLYMQSANNSSSISQKVQRSYNNNQNNQNSQQYEYMVKQNKKLKERVKQLERNQQRLHNNIQQIVVKLVNKYRDSLLKQTMLLTDRYRLQKKVNDRN